MSTLYTTFQALYEEQTKGGADMRPFIIRDEGIYKYTIVPISQELCVCSMGEPIEPGEVFVTVPVGGDQGDTLYALEDFFSDVSSEAAERWSISLCSCDLFLGAPCVCEAGQAELQAERVAKGAR